MSSIPTQSNRPLNYLKESALSATTSAERQAKEVAGDIDQIPDETVHYEEMAALMEYHASQCKEIAEKIRELLKTKDDSQ